MCPTASVKPGQVIQVEALGCKFAVWRSKAGKLGVFDAFCPHGGANLACGDVVDDSLRCPFHFVEFSRDGAVANVPWLDEPPKASAIAAKAYDFEEYYGMVFFWFDAEGRPPAYELPRIPDIDGRRTASRSVAVTASRTRRRSHFDGA